MCEGAACGISRRWHPVREVSSERRDKKYEVTDRRPGLKGVASAGLAAVICAVLASCSAMAPTNGQGAAGNTPDLEVEVRVNDSAPVVGGRFTIAATVRNAGGAAAEATTLRYYRSTDARITRADTEVGMAAVAPIAASEAGGKSVELSAPSKPGTYYYGACVDAVANESNLTNNCSPSEQITVRERQDDDGHPDLVVLAASVSDSAPAADATFTLSAVARNSGGGVADATTLRYYQSTDATITTADTEVATEAITGLAGAGSAGRSVKLTAPSTPGTYYYGACVDTLANESDLTNNCSTSVQVTVPEPQLPELLVTWASVNDDGPVIGAPLTLSVTVRNAGGGTSEATELRYYRSTDATITPTDMHVGTEPIAELAGAGSAGKSVDLTAPATPGTHYYGACVQAVTGESDTANNCSPSVPVTARAQARESQGDPDLVVTSPSVSDSGPTAGATFSLSAAVRNDGDGAAAATTLRFYRSADSTITTADSTVGTASVAGLAASGSAGGSVDLTAPATPGTYYYGACVDAVTGESDTTNNCSSTVTVTVPAPKHPDLTVTSPSVSDSSPAAGGSVTLSATVSNRGNGAAAATTLRYYQSADATITTADTQVGTSAIAGLAASGSAGGSVDLTAPSSAGTYYYGACVEAVTGESDTANNCSSSATVTVTAPQPDLEVATTVADTTQQPGATFSLSATVSNTGDGASPSTMLRYYQSTDATITTSDTSVGTDAVGTLAASGTSAESISLTAPSSAGTYYYGACVDTVTDESDTTNNCSSAVQVNVQADVQEPKPDLLMSNLRVDLANPVTGETFTLSVDVLNGSRAATAATTLRYYRSADSTITTSDTEVGTDAVDALSAYGSSAESISLTAPATTGAYYYGACVDAVAGETDMTYNCSPAVKVDVVAQQRRVDISPRELTFEAVGDSETVTVRILDENGDEDTEASYVWISFYPLGGPCCTLKKVDDGLEVTMTKAGTMQVDLSSTGARSIRLRVTAYQRATTLEVSPNSVSLEVDGTDTLSATVKDTNGHAIEGRTVYWTTSDSEVATVQGADAGGETGATATVTAAATGTATITARHAVAIRGTAAVTVTSSTEQ